MWNKTITMWYILFLRYVSLVYQCIKNKNHVKSSPPAMLISYDLNLRKNIRYFSCIILTSIFRGIFQTAKILFQAPQVVSAVTTNLAN